MTATKNGEWERDKMCRSALLAGDEEPFVWDFGSAAIHHKHYCDWLDPEHCRAGVVGMRGTIASSFGLMKRYAQEIYSRLKKAGVADMPVGFEFAETTMFFALKDAGVNVVDGQQIMLSAREIKNIDEIQLLNQAASMVDCVYHMIWEELKPGVRENDIVAMANKMLYEMGSHDVEAINAISGERCNRHLHNFTDRLFRSGDQAFFDILRSYQGYRTCYYRTFNIGRATPVQTDAYVRLEHYRVSKPNVDLEVLRGKLSSIVDQLTSGLNAIAKRRKVTVVRGLAGFQTPTTWTLMVRVGALIMRSLPWGRARRACMAGPMPPDIGFDRHARTS